MSSDGEEGDDWWNDDHDHDDGLDLESNAGSGAPLGALLGKGGGQATVPRGHGGGGVKQSSPHGKGTHRSPPPSHAGAMSGGGGGGGQMDAAVMLRNHLEEAEGEIVRLRGIIRQVDQGGGPAPVPAALSPKGGESGDPRDG